MNERIYELYKLSHIDYKGSKAFDPAKFALLIVAECVEVCHKMAEDSDSYVVHDGDACAEQINQHFGVDNE